MHFSVTYRLKVLTLHDIIDTKCPPLLLLPVQGSRLVRVSFEDYCLIAQLCMEWHVQVTECVV